MEIKFRKNPTKFHPNPNFRSLFLTDFPIFLIFVGPTTRAIYSETRLETFVNQLHQTSLEISKWPKNDQRILPKDHQTNTPKCFQESLFKSKPSLALDLLSRVQLLDLMIILRNWCKNTNRLNGHKLNTIQERTAVWIRQKRFHLRAILSLLCQSLFPPAPRLVITPYLRITAGIPEGPLRTPQLYAFHTTTPNHSRPLYFSAYDFLAFSNSGIFSTQSTQNVCLTIRTPLGIPGGASKKKRILFTNALDICKFLDCDCTIWVYDSIQLPSDIEFLLTHVSTAVHQLT